MKPTDQPRFLRRMKQFLARTRIHGVGIPLTPLDIVLVAAGAVIPTWGFPEWTYNNLTDVLLYPQAFDQQHFAKEHENRHNTIGMVGSGAMERVMILSEPALREGFPTQDPSSQGFHGGHGNTAIHEFVHLIDKSDGAVDGIPESLLGDKAQAWTDLVHAYLGPVGAGHTDINPYGGTNAAEFFAVVSEYYFQRPDQLRERHPDLFALLFHIFRYAPQLPQNGPPEPA
jgi:Mlc titration factor MtfA (ptsG expression regulator)